MKTNYIFFALGVISLLFITINNSCKKEPQKEIPTLSTADATNISTTSATLGGNVLSDGNSTVTDKGVVYSTNSHPTTSNNKVSYSSGGLGEFLVSVETLTPKTTYYVRAYAVNSIGTAYGSQVYFTTGIIPEAFFTAEPTTITEGHSTRFTDRSINNPTSWNWAFGDGNTSNLQYPSHTYDTPGNYTVSLTVANSFGSDTHIKTNFITVIAFGDIIFNPNLTYGTVSDIEGNTYKTIQIGTQLWMAENLKTTKYRNGDLIGTTTPPTLIIYNQVSPKYQWAYNGDESHVAIYGRLYTWHTAIDSRGLCPSGWHVPTNEEWTILTTYLLNDASYLGANIGAKLKEVGTSHWRSPNAKSTNSSGFTALPGGIKLWSYGLFTNMGYHGQWLSSTESDPNDPTLEELVWTRLLTSNYMGIFDYYGNKAGGFSVRCIKDN